MERRHEGDPRKEEENREHGRSDRGGPGREQRQPGRQPGEAQRPPGREREDQPSERDDGARKFGERRDQPPSGGRRDRRS